MDKYDELEWIRVIKTAYLHGQDQRLQPYEEAYAKQAANYFHGEAAYLLNLPFSSIEAYIGEKVTTILISTAFLNHCLYTMYKEWKLCAVASELF